MQPGQKETTCPRPMSMSADATDYGDYREGDGCIGRENQNLKQMVAWITMHNTMDLDSLDCDANQEQRSGAYCSVLSRVTCHVTRDQPRVFVVFN